MGFSANLFDYPTYRELKPESDMRFKCLSISDALQSSLTAEQGIFDVVRRYRLDRVR